MNGACVNQTKPYDVPPSMGGAEDSCLSRMCGELLLFPPQSISLPACVSVPFVLCISEPVLLVARRESKQH